MRVFDLGLLKIFVSLVRVGCLFWFLKGSKHITPKNARQNDFILKKMPDNLPFLEITRILYKMWILKGGEVSNSEKKWSCVTYES